MAGPRLDEAKKPVKVNGEERIGEQQLYWGERLERDLDKRMPMHQQRMAPEYGHLAPEMSEDQAWSYLPIHHCI